MPGKIGQKNEYAKKNLLQVLCIFSTLMHLRYVIFSHQAVPEFIAIVYDCDIFFKENALIRIILNNFYDKYTFSLLIFTNHMVFSFFFIIFIFFSFSGGVSRNTGIRGGGSRITGIRGGIDINGDSIYKSGIVKSIRCLPVTKKMKKEKTSAQMHKCLFGELSTFTYSKRSHLWMKRIQHPHPVLP